METIRNPPMGNPPDNNLVWAILSTVFCCLPLGIVSIIKATKVRELWALGDTVGAQKAADDAKKWAMIAAAVSLAGIVIYVLVIVVFGIGGAFAGYN